MLFMLKNVKEIQILWEKGHKEQNKTTKDKWNIWNEN